MQCPLNGIFEDLKGRFVFLRYSGMPDNTGHEIREGHVIMGPDGTERLVTYKPGVLGDVIPGQPQWNLPLVPYSINVIVAGEDVLAGIFPVVKLVGNILLINAQGL